jgi:hypothetical protein
VLKHRWYLNTGLYGIVVAWTPRQKNNTRPKFIATL